MVPSSLVLVHWLIMNTKTAKMLLLPILPYLPSKNPSKPLMLYDLLSKNHAISASRLSLRQEQMWIHRKRKPRLKLEGKGESKICRTIMRTKMSWLEMMKVVVSGIKVKERFKLKIKRREMDKMRGKSLASFRRGMLSMMMMVMRAGNQQEKTHSRH
jgi:hypothetical protein